MKLLCWLVLIVLLVESLQDGDGQKTASVAPEKAEAGEGSGQGSDSSEERTEETTVNNGNSLSVPILPLDGAADSNEAIKGALKRNTAKKPENSADSEHSALLMLEDNSAPQTEAQDGKDSPKTLTQSGGPSLFRSYLYDGKLRAGIEDTITLPPTSGDAHDGEEQRLRGESPLNDGKSGVVVDNGKLSDIVEEDDQVLDGKLGKEVPQSRVTGIPPPDEASSTTGAVDIGTEISAAQLATTNPSSPSVIDSAKSTTVQEHPSNEPTHDQVQGGSSPFHGTDDSGPSTLASTSAGPETSLAGNDITTNSSNSSAHPSNETTSPTENSSTAEAESAIVTDSLEPVLKAVDVDTFDRIVFQQGGMASCKQKPEACSQNLTKLQCIGGFCKEPIETVTCDRVADLEAENNVSSIRFTVPIKWTCGSSDFEPDFQITKSSVVCEGYNHPGDNMIVENSCTLLFHLDRINSSALRSKDHGSNNSVIAIILTVAAVTAMGYFIIKAVLLKRRHGHWVPSYCAVPLKARMNFRRKRQTDYDEEPVNIHFDMGEEQTALGRSRVRSYGPQ